MLKVRQGVRDDLRLLDTRDHFQPPTAARAVLDLELGDALSLLYSGAFSARISSGGGEQISAVSAATTALLDSPVLGAPKS